jgi:twitching motility protein PilI
MAITAPFELLQSLDSRCRRNSSGMPTSQAVSDDWVGIGFRINNIPLLAKMDEVDEISPIPDTIRVPGVKSWVKGLANIRGSLMPVLDMRAYLFGNATELHKNSRILIIDQMGLSAGLLVEEVYGMRRFKPDERGEEIDPDIGSIGEYLIGNFVDRVQRWNIFSVDKLVKTDQFMRVV